MGTKRILVVDDEPPIRHVAEQAITGHGWEADTAANSAEALQMIRDNLYDAIVVDFSLPDMDGVALHSEIRRLDTELAEHTLFISGLDQSNKQLRYYTDAGGFLPKPFDIDELIGRLRDMLNE
jgi:two-component system cell cycle sensor histidine kinase/response regulator CckA